MSKFETVSDEDFEEYMKNGPGMPAVPMPNSIPTGSRFGNSTESYASGIPPSPSPSWVEAAVQRRRDRLAGLRLPAPDEETT